MGSSNPFDVLGLSPHASKREIKKAYRRLAKKLHPDANPDDPEAHIKFQALNEAYEDALIRAKNRKRFKDLDQHINTPDVCNKEEMETTGNSGQTCPQLSTENLSARSANTNCW